ncbi:MAG: C40 family peptidase [Treponema sp.]|nr:C40 family peptidase [Treponema sp.]
MKKTPVFLIILFFLVILIPQLCAQSVSPEKAAEMRTTFVDYSKQFIGRPYQSGGIGPDAFDCSGLIFTCSRESIGFQLPRKTSAMFAFCKPIADSEKEAGDLVFFKTTASGDISHVGVYIGNSQFIHAASDGPNTGVIISSLRENYWKNHYDSARRFLPASKSEALAEEPAKKNAVAKTQAKSTPQAKSSGNKAASRSQSPFLSSVILDGSLFVDWNFFTSRNIRLNFRGASGLIHAKYAGKTLQPGIGAFLRYDSGTGVFQLPLVASLSFGEYVRAYMGPVLSFGTPSLPGDSDTEIEASFFPGIMGICWQTPSLTKSEHVALSLVQDIHYTIFNRTNGAALAGVDSIASGLVFSTGLRVTFPLKSLL